MSTSEPAIYRPFLVTAIVATLTLGSGFGAYNLLMLHWAVGPVPSAHHWSHAQFQIWGFVLLFIMGVSYHVVPRLLRTELRWAALARATLWLSIGALALQTRGHLSGLLAPAPVALLLGGAVQLMAVLGWVTVLAGTWRASSPPRAPYEHFLIAGCLWWLVAAGLVLASTVVAFQRNDAGAVSSFNESIYAAALFGGTLGWIFGMGVRMVRGFLNLAAPNPTALAVVFALGQCGAALGTLGPFVAGRGGQLAGDMGLLAVAATLVAFAFALRPFQLRTLPIMTSDPGSPAIIRAAFVGSLLFVALAGAYAVLDVVGASPSRLLYDGARHAFTLGFVALMIFGVAGRVVAAFRGVAVHWPRLRIAGVYLIALGVLLRQAEILAAYLHTPWLLYVSGASGVLAAAGIWLASASILATLMSEARRATIAPDGA